MHLFKDTSRVKIEPEASSEVTGTEVASIEEDYSEEYMNSYQEQEIDYQYYQEQGEESPGYWSVKV